MTSIANAGGGASATLTLPLQITVSLGAKKKLLLWGNIENHIAKEATHVDGLRHSALSPACAGSLAFF